MSVLVLARVCAAVGLDLSLHGEAGYHLSEDALSMSAVGHEGLPDARGTRDVATAH